MPEAMAFGDVASAAGLASECGSEETGERDDDAVLVDGGGGVDEVAEAGGGMTDDHALPIGDGGGGAIGVGVVGGFDGLVGDDLFPQPFAVGAIEAPQSAFVSLGVELLGEEDALAPDDRRGVRFFGQR